MSDPETAMDINCQTNMKIFLNPTRISLTKEAIHCMPLCQDVGEIDELDGQIAKGKMGLELRLGTIHLLRYHHQ